MPGDDSWGIVRQSRHSPDGKMRQPTRRGSEHAFFKVLEKSKVPELKPRRLWDELVPGGTRASANTSGPDFTSAEERR